MSYWSSVVGHDWVLCSTTLYVFELTDNDGKQHVVQAYGIEQISDDTWTVNLKKVQKVFPGAPREVYN